MQVLLLNLFLKRMISYGNYNNKPISLLNRKPKITSKHLKDEKTKRNEALLVDVCAITSPPHC